MLLSVTIFYINVTEAPLLILDAGCE